MNKKCKKVFKIISTENGKVVTVSLKRMLRYIFKLYKQQGGTIDKVMNYEFKICCDGRQILNKNQVALATIPLSMEDIFKTQEVLSVFYFGLMEMDETKENVIKYFTSVFKEQIEDIEKNGIVVDDEKVNVFFTYVSDLKNCGQVMDTDCLCCKKKMSEQTHSNVFVINHDYYGEDKKSEFGIKYTNHVFCTLHMKQRIHERLIAYMAGLLDDSDFEKITNNIRGIKCCGDFHWREKKSKHVTSLDAEGYETDRTLFIPNQIRGGAIDVMLNNIDTIFEGITSNRVNDCKVLLQLWRNIVCHFQATNDEIRSDSNFYNTLNVSVKLFLALFARIFPNKSMRSPYLHLLTHLEYYIKKFGSLARYSNQGFENSHKYHKTLLGRISNNGGSATKISNVEFIMYWQCRKMLTCIGSNSKWGSLVKHREEKVSTTEATEDATQKKVTKKELSALNYTRFVKENWSVPSEQVQVIIQRLEQAQQPQQQQQQQQPQPKSRGRPKNQQPQQSQPQNQVSKRKYSDPNVVIPQGASNKKTKK